MALTYFDISLFLSELLFCLEILPALVQIFVVFVRTSPMLIFEPVFLVKFIFFETSFCVLLSLILIKSKLESTLFLFWLSFAIRGSFTSKSLHSSLDFILIVVEVHNLSRLLLSSTFFSNWHPSLESLSTFHALLLGHIFRFNTKFDSALLTSFLLFLDFIECLIWITISIFVISESEGADHSLLFQGEFRHWFSICIDFWNGSRFSFNNYLGLFNHDGLSLNNWCCLWDWLRFWS